MGAGRFADGRHAPDDSFDRAPVQWAMRIRQQRFTGYFHVISIPKKCMKTSRFGLFLGFC